MAATILTTAYINMCFQYAGHWPIFLTICDHDRYFSEEETEAQRG